MKTLFFIAAILFCQLLIGQAVGIGTSTPTPGYLLDVNGNLNSKGFRLNGTGNYFLMVDGNNSNNLFRWTVNSGYLRKAYNTLSPFSTKDVLIIDSTGKVGIGPNNPTAWLDVNNTTSGFGELAKFNGGNSMWVTFAENGLNRGYIGSYAGNPEDFEMGTYASNASGKVILSTGNLPRLSIDNAGRVGVGALPTSGYRMNVSGGNFLLNNTSSDLELNLQTNTTNRKSLKFLNQTGGIDHSIESINSNLYFRRMDAEFPSMAWDANDRFGIGTFAPTTKLNVVGGDEVDLTRHGSIMIGNTTSANMAIDENEIQARSNSAGADLFVQHNGGNLLLCGNELGGVGIGIASGASMPVGSLLAVDGKITCEEVLVKLSQNWPDYVFADDYKLMDLEKLKSFIDKNKHLPGVPSASVIAQNGLELGQVQKTMMEKIEELTLYIIQLENRIKTLESKK
jgi:hypothetical protein